MEGTQGFVSSQVSLHQVLLSTTTEHTRTNSRPTASNPQQTSQSKPHISHLCAIPFENSKRIQSFLIYLFSWMEWYISSTFHLSIHIAKTFSSILEVKWNVITFSSCFQYWDEQDSLHCSLSEGLCSFKDNFVNIVEIRTTREIFWAGKSLKQFCLMVLAERRGDRNTDQGNKWLCQMTCGVFYWRHKHQLDLNTI